MKKFIRDLWLILVERCKVHRALRIMNKQEWSIEFLTALLQRASKVAKEDLEIVIMSPNGAQMIVRTTEQLNALRDDSIFNHLDDEVKMKAFMDAIK
jgi:hypothetical protein